MEYRRLGRTDLSVSVICLGTMTWGDQNTEAEGHAQMDYALAHGVNFWDTAELYSTPPKAETAGSTERIIGNWFKSRGQRDRVILATKVVGRSGNAWFRDDGSPARLTRPQIEEAVNKSLKRLQTDYIDLYQLHWPDREMPWGSNPTVYEAIGADGEPIHETLHVLDGLVKAGKIRHVGISNESAWGTMTFVQESVTRGLPRVVSIQNAYNLLNRTFEVALAEVALREQVGLLAYSPLAQGTLSGKYLHGALPPGSRKALHSRMNRYEKPGSAEATEKYVALAQEFGLDPAQMALAFVTGRPFVTSNIIGATSIDQLARNIASVDVRITDDLMQRINAIHQVHCNPAP